MKMSIGDVVDRWTIAMLKNYRAKEDNHKEIWAYQEYCQKYDSKIVKECWDKMYFFNGKIWDLESDIRKGKEGELGLEEVGRRAIQIREYNKERILWKNKLNESFGEGFIEYKHDHSSK